MNINRLIHLKYRERLLQVSKYYGARKRIPKALGPENIIYGDKVINVINNTRESWPKENSRNYVANGEIGIACGSYSAKKANDYLHVEFASQKGVSYTYTGQDFNEESGTACLELAYALTVHKAQGNSKLHNRRGAYHAGLPACVLPERVHFSGSAGSRRASGGERHIMGVGCGLRILHKQEVRLREQKQKRPQGGSCLRHVEADHASY